MVLESDIPIHITQISHHYNICKVDLVIDCKDRRGLRNWGVTSLVFAHIIHAYIQPFSQTVSVTKLVRDRSV